MKSDRSTSPPRVVPENPLEERVIGDLITRIIEEMDRGELTTLRYDGEPWPLQMGISPKPIGEGWFRGTVSRSRPDSGPIDLDAVDFNDYQVALGWWEPVERGGPRLLWRRDPEEQATTAEFFSSHDDRGWR